MSRLIVPVAKHNTISHPSLIQPLLLLFVIALLVRSVGLLWGGEHPDENIGMSAKVLTGQLIPDRHYYPPLLNYINAIAFASMYLIGRLFGVWWNLTEFRAQYFENPVIFEFAARFVTACLGSAAAPLAALIAQCFQIPWRLCLVVGGLAALLPVQVWLSHISKSDAALSSAVMLVVWTLLRKLDLPNSKAADVLCGISIALTLSFKQSGLFAIAPLVLGFFVLVVNRVGWRRVIQSVTIMIASTVVLWIPLNIGILLDFRNYLEYQEILKLMWNQSNDGLGSVLGNWLSIEVNTYQGATAPALLMWLVVPALRDKRTLWLWGSTAIAIIIVMSIAGTTNHPSLWLPYSMLIAVLGGVAAAKLLTSRDRRGHLIGAVALTVMLVWSGVGTMSVLWQALTSPLNKQVASEISFKPKATRILSAVSLAQVLPIDPQAQEDAYQRHERLAQKYGVHLPQRAPEKVSKSTPNGYYIRDFPAAFGKLETYDEKEITVVKPFSWPLQKEEWQLSYWLDRGFNIFIVQNEVFFLRTEVDAYRRFHEQIRDSCELLKVMPSRRPLFWEEEVRVYKCE